ncbi:hypothetical protein ACIBW9_34170 [Streptomyces sp. NPDC049541]|uniref:hypothetical protein n=1 Tax=Streptomyces sp. NPDC049541 TaxID=3365594 RepID=UPI0037AD71CE
MADEPKITGRPEAAEPTGQGPGNHTRKRGCPVVGDDEDYGSAHFTIDLDDTGVVADARLLGQPIQNALNRATNGIARQISRNPQNSLRNVSVQIPSNRTGSTRSSSTGFAASSRRTSPWPRMFGTITVHGPTGATAHLRDLAPHLAHHCAPSPTS